MILEERMEDLSSAGPYADRLSIETIACDALSGISVSRDCSG